MMYPLVLFEGEYQKNVKSECLKVVTFICDLDQYLLQTTGLRSSQSVLYDFSIKFQVLKIKKQVNTSTHMFASASTS